MEIVFFILIGLYFTVARSIDCWITISLLGFDLECPEGFLRSEIAYHIVAWALFIAALVVGIFSTLHGGVIFISLALAWFLSGKLGHASAYTKYRKNVEEMIDDPLTSIDEQELKRMLELSDSELRDKAMNMARFHKSTRG